MIRTSRDATDRDKPRSDPRPRAEPQPCELNTTPSPAGNSGRAGRSLCFRLPPPRAVSRPHQTTSRPPPRWQCSAPPFGLVSLRPCPAMNCLHRNSGMLVNNPGAVPPVLVGHRTRGAPSCSQPPRPKTGTRDIT